MLTIETKEFPTRGVEVLYLFSQAQVWKRAGKRAYEIKKYPEVLQVMQSSN